MTMNDVEIIEIPLTDLQIVHLRIANKLEMQHTALVNKMLLRVYFGDAYVGTNNIV